MAWTRMDADRHPQLDVLGDHRLDRPLHVRSRPGGALFVTIAAKEEEQRVAAELQDVAAVPLGDLDQTVEAARDAADELLGAGPAPGREPLGERGEPGDVDRDEGALLDPEARALRLRAPGVD